VGFAVAGSTEDKVQAIVMSEHRWALLVPIEPTSGAAVAHPARAGRGQE
jgi:hypothetical protein